MSMFLKEFFFKLQVFMKYVTNLTTFNLELLIIGQGPRLKVLRLGLHRLYIDRNKPLRSM